MQNMQHLCFFFESLCLSIIDEAVYISYIPCSGSFYICFKFLSIPCRQIEETKDFVVLKKPQSERWLRLLRKNMGRTLF